MNQEVGRAGFHVVHTKAVSERGAILHEMMRELDPESIAHWAARNTSIVVADEVLNRAYVNDGEGGFVRCTDRQQVLDYGDTRIARVRRKITAPRADPVTGEMKGGTTTTTMIVAHLPKSLCAEVEDYYPLVHTRGPRKGQQQFDAAGRPRYRSRWVARDRDEAERYFNDVTDIIASHMSPGGQAGILGYDIQHSESTPHIQLLLDAFGDDPKHEGALRADASRVWFPHRGHMAQLHDQLKRELIDRGWDISPDFDQQRHMYGGTKDEYAVLQEAKAGIIDELTDRTEELNDREAGLARRERELTTAEDEIPARRRRAIEEGNAAGREQGLRDGIAQALQDAQPQIDAELRRLTQLLRKQFAAKERALDESLEHARKLISGTTREDVPLALDAFLDEPTSEGSLTTFRNKYAAFARKMREDPPLGRQKMEAARSAKAARKAAASSRIRELEAHVAQLEREEQSDGWER